MMKNMKTKSVLRGTERRMIKIVHPDSELFDEAYFILKPNARYGNSDDSSTLVEEASRIVCDNLMSVKCTGITSRRLAKRDKIISFFAGAATCAMLALFVFLLL
ncbi:MAG: hypothetical protein WAO54_01850 [Eubacteriales bacterium]|jgi:hypothetical protein|nr:hypothetical protein [Clostridiales bacterium]